MEAKKTAIVGLILVVLMFLGVTVLADNALRGARLDLTENSIYTLSPATKKILKKLDEPIALTLYFSQSLAKGRPQLESYGTRVRELLEEYQLYSHGDVKLTVLDPEPFSEAEDQAKKDGITGLPLGQGENFYFGLVGTNSTDGHEVIPVFDPSQERFLEYDVSKMIHKLSTAKKPVVGLLSDLPMQGDEPQPGSQGGARPWAIMHQINELFTVRPIAPTATEIPAGLDILLIVHPKQVSDQLLGSINDYVMGGGAMIVCQDPLCEADMPPGAAQNPAVLMQANRSSNLNKLLTPWGVTMNPDQVVIDLDNAIRGPSRSGQTVPYVQYLQLGPKLMDQDDAVTGGMSQLNMGTVGSLVFDESKGTTWTPLVWTGDDSAEVAAARLAFFPNPEDFVAGYVGSGGRRVVAGRLTGKAHSAFPTPGAAPAKDAEAKPADAAKPGDTSAADTDKADEKADASKPAAAPAGETHDINVLVVSDCDFLSDRWWVQEIRMGNMVLGYQKQADNADLIINALDNMAGSSDLIALRATGTFTRPFTLVEKIQRDAEAQYLAEAKDLQKKQQETEQRIKQLQQARPDSGGLILTPEQEAEIKKFQDQLASTNKQLRDVRYKLRKNVEQLGTTLKIVNTILAPALVALGAVGLGAYRAVRRRNDRRSMAGKG